MTAPPFDTVDVFGKQHRLEDHAGKVVLVNVWATWCGPCKKEMPKLDRLYQDRKGEGFMVFGLSTEDVEEQRRFNQEQVRVSYPLLTMAGKVPDMYRNTAQYPANFLIDRGTIAAGTGHRGAFREARGRRELAPEGRSVVRPHRSTTTPVCCVGRISAHQWPADTPLPSSR